MESGNREYKPGLFTGVAVASTFKPDTDKAAASGFQIIDIALKWSAAPVEASELITVTSTRDGVDYLEHEFDPSTSTATTTMFRFDKRFPAGTTISLAYLNTDARTVNTSIQFQLDTEV